MTAITDNPAKPALKFQQSRFHVYSVQPWELFELSEPAARGFMTALPISDWLKVEESARLLHAIFPNYPALYPCRPTPPMEEWPLLINCSLGH